MEHFIRFYDQIIAPEVCEQAIARFDASADTSPGRVLKSDGNTAVDLSVKRTTELIISGRPQWNDIETALQAGFVECVNRYASEFPHIESMSGNMTSEVFRLKKYEQDGFFDWHIDSGGKNQARVIAIQFYLNDVHQGGATEFKFQDTAVAAVQGRVAIFPTLWTYLHRGAPVISNEKYVCTNFVLITNTA